MDKRFAIISKDGKFYLADKKSEVRQEMTQETVGGKIAWVSTSNRRALIPNDQVMGYFAMSEAEFNRLEIGNHSLMALEDFTPMDAKIVAK